MNSSLATEILAVQVRSLIELGQHHPDPGLYDQVLCSILHDFEKGIATLTNSPPTPDNPSRLSPLASPRSPLSPLTPLSQLSAIMDEAPNMVQGHRPAMPAKGHSTAPIFDPDRPRTLCAYFQDLEALFERCSVDVDRLQKRWSIRYVPIEVADFWEDLAEFDDDHTFDEYKTAIMALYPGAERDHQYDITNLEELTTRRGATAITTTGELTSYHREFLAISKHLLQRELLSPLDEKRLFVKGIRDPLWSQVVQRLQLKFPDHFPRNPYPVNDVLEAAKFILHGTSTTPVAAPQAPVTTTDTATPTSAIKAEDLEPLLRLMTRAVRDVAPSQGSAPRGSGPAPPTGFCHYCGDAGCQVRTCPHVEEDIKSNRIARNNEGKVVLPNGSFVPRSMPGLTMRDRVYEWHRRNPANPTGTVNQLFFASPTYSAPDDDDDRIARLEQEIFAL